MDLPDLVVVDESDEDYAAWKGATAEGNRIHPWQLDQEDLFNDEDLDPPLSKEGGLSDLMLCIARCLADIVRRRPFKTGFHAKGTARARTHAFM